MQATQPLSLFEQQVDGAIRSSIFRLLPPAPLDRLLTDDAVPVGDPCPNCGGKRRDATVTPQTVVAIAMVWPGGHTEPMWKVEQSVSHGTDAIIAAAPVELPDRAWRRLEELATDAPKLEVWIHEPGEDGAVLCEVMAEDGHRLGAEVGTDAEDAVNVADLIAGVRGRTRISG